MYVQAKAAGPFLIDAAVAVAVAIAIVVVVVALRTHFDTDPKHCTSHSRADGGFARCVASQ